MNPSSHRPFFGFTSLRTAITAFFIAVLLLYSLYSSKIILTKQNDLTCSLLSTEVTTKQNLETEDDDTAAVSPPPPPPPSPPPPPPPNISTCDCSTALVSSPARQKKTELKNVVFGIAASSSLWDKRKEYIKLWWRQNETRGVVWLDKSVKVSDDEQKNLPEIRISGDTSKFDYTNKQGKRSVLRISRVVSETLRLGMKDVKWFLMGDEGGGGEGGGGGGGETAAVSSSSVSRFCLVVTSVESREQVRSFCLVRMILEE